MSEPRIYIEITYFTELTPDEFLPDGDDSVAVTRGAVEEWVASVSAADLISDWFGNPPVVSVDLVGTMPNGPHGNCYIDERHFHIKDRA